MSELCQITPISAFMSTNLNSKIECYRELGQRILRTLGHPTVNVEVHPDALYDNISIATEFFTKYAGYTKEYLIFDSNLYEHNKGLKLDNLFTVANTGFNLSQRLSDPPPRENPSFLVDKERNTFVTLSAIPQSTFAGSSALSGAVPKEGLQEMQVIDTTAFNHISAYDPTLVRYFKKSPQITLTSQCEPISGATKLNNMFDYDTMDYRKVISVTDFEEGSTTGINTLFTLEQTLAQQTYFSYAMGNYGFDLLTWHTTKEWLDTREKMLATNRDVYFDNRTQYLRMFPQPNQGARFYGVLACYVERPIRDVIKEQWVYKYSTALTKITWGRILTKISSVQLIGGGLFNGDTLLQEGIQERDQLEELLYDGASSGYGDSDSIGIFIA